MFKKMFMVFLILFPLQLRSQTNTTVDSFIIIGKQKISQAQNTWQETDFITARAYFERLLPDPTYPWLVHYYIALVDYRLFAFYNSQKNKEKVKNYIEDGIEQLNASVKLKDDFADGYSLLSSLYGNKIGTNPLLGMTLGPKSGAAMAKAMRLEPKNPRNNLIAGLSAYYTPVMFGGGKDKAERNFKQAIINFDSTKVENAILPDWGHDEVYAWLGQLLMDKNDYTAAQANFEKALQINPNYGWVKYNLLPTLQKKIEEQGK
jgi:tetratricopeptide (TPR) repeat protein